MGEKSKHNKLDSDCTLPPDHPLPPDQLGRYSPARDFYAEKDIAEYVLSQARDETVQNVERVKTEYVMGAPYEIWDISTDKDRWWVITNPTNLYSQRHFPSLDYTLSFHVGLMMRVASRSERAGEPEPSPFDEVFRRQNHCRVRAKPSAGRGGRYAATRVPHFACCCGSTARRNQQRRRTSEGCRCYWVEQVIARPALPRREERRASRLFEGYDRKGMAIGQLAYASSKREQDGFFDHGGRNRLDCEALCEIT
jgi:hypothetical protein